MLYGFTDFIPKWDFSRIFALYHLAGNQLYKYWGGGDSRVWGGGAQRHVLRKKPVCETRTKPTHLLRLLFAILWIRLSSEHLTVSRWTKKRTDLFLWLSVFVKRHTIVMLSDHISRSIYYRKDSRWALWILPIFRYSTVDPVEEL